MYYPIKDGSVEKIYGYECQLPPVGYGKNVVNGELEFVGIASSSSIKKEQVWVRTELPKDWKIKRGKELLKMSNDPDYIDPALEQFRQQEWRRRLCGYWFMNNGIPTYITGLNYFYATWWKLDGIYPDYRDSDRKYYYVVAYCIEDPRCAGLIYAANRRAGKTYKGTCLLFEYISRSQDKYAGIQSKTGADAKAVFSNKLINSFYNLPDFFRPVFDTGKSIRPSAELRFQNANKKGAKAVLDFGKVELNSWIDWKSSEKFAYDGAKLHRYLGDEVGKTPNEVDVYARHQVVKYCLTQNGQWVGFAIYTTTVELMESGNTFQKMWMDSDPQVRDKNDQTKTGLYRYFIPAFEATSFDKYGMPNVEEDKLFYLNRRAALSGNDLTSEIKKNAFNEHEMFMTNGEKCLYNSLKLNQRLDVLSWNETTERGNFEWKDAVRDSEVLWVKTKNGRWEMPLGFSLAVPNNTIHRGNGYVPGNKMRFISAVDPYDHDTTQDDGRQSKAASFVLQKNNPLDGDNPFNKAFVCKYHARPAMASMMYEDMIMQSFYFGSPLLYETNKPGIKRYFFDRGYGGFLIYIPGYKEPGIPSTPENKQTLAELTEEYVENHIEKVFFSSLCVDWLNFDLKNTQPSDEAMAAGWTLVADMQIVFKRESSSTREVTDYFRMKKVS